MRTPAPSSPGRRARCIGFALTLSAITGLAWAAPDEPLDPVMKLLADKGLIGQPAPAASDEALAAAESSLMRRVQDRASDMVVSAMNFIGVPYRRGGNSAQTGFDCSGFTRHVFEMSLGMMLPRSAVEQATALGFVKVKREELKPGDLVFFNTMRRTFSHVGIYIGDNRFIHAPSHGKEVRTDDLGFAYWAQRFSGARRAELPATAQAAIESPTENSAHPEPIRR